MSLVAEFYRDAQKEWDRLDIPLFRIEFATTLDLIGNYFKTGDRVADIGGGPGRYMIELLRRGCRATLFELSPENVAFAEAKVAEMGLTADAFPYVGPSNLSSSSCFRLLWFGCRNRGGLLPDCECPTRTGETFCVTS